MKSLHESFTKFFENPTRDKFRELIQFNTGEYDNLDFKKEWQESSKIARHVLAISNSGGGVIVLGVEESENKVLKSCGLSDIKDKAIIDSQIKSYLPDNINYEVLDFTYSDSEYNDLIGKSFQVMIIDYNPSNIPFVSMKSGKNLKENCIYVRQGTSSVIANYNQVQKLLNNRIATNHNTSSEIKLEEHLNQLKLLYDRIDKYNYIHVKPKDGTQTLASAMSVFLTNISVSINGEKKAIKNPKYPDEDYEEFISRLIHMKKSRIERLLDV